MSDPRPGGWLSGLALGGVSGLMLLALGTMGTIFALLSVTLIAWKGPGLIAAAGMLTGLGLVWTVLFGLNALTCGGPLDLGSSTCVAPDLTGWIVTGGTILGVGLIASAFALRRSRR